MSSPHPARCVARDPAWIRATTRALLDRLASDGPPTPRRVDPLEDRPLPSEGGRARLDLPHSEEESAACAQVAGMAAVLGFEPIEADLLLLGAALSWIRPIDGLLGEIEAPTRGALFAALAHVLGARHVDVRRALRSGGRLWDSASLRVTGERPVRLEIDPESSEIGELGQPGVTAADLVASMVPASPAAVLPLDAHAHLGEVVEVARRLLAGALASRTAGIHLLVHGAPGLGKTELVRALIAAAGGDGIDVPSTWACGVARPARMRLTAWSTAQGLLAARDGAVLVFDEAEDAVATLVQADHGGPRAKGAFTRELEEAPTPTVWIANDVSELDPAYLRRMALVVPVGPPPVSTRRAIVDALLEPRGVSAAAREALAREPSLSPALVAQAARSLDLVGDAEPGATDRFARALFAGHVASVGAAPRATDRFDPAWVSLADGVSAAALAERLDRAGSGRVLLHGLPGTGKSAFARYVADISSRPLHVHAAADLLGSLVGQTEARLRDAFRDAASAGAVLVLDEVDALLHDRREAVRSWEVTQVAQALVSLEAYDGLLVATSNLLPRVDPAFHRRFDLVLEVTTPGPDARRRMLDALASQLDLPPPDDAIAARLVGLVPGHVAQAVRRWRLVGAPTTTDALVAQLHALVRGPIKRSTVGFGAVTVARG